MRDLIKFFSIFTFSQKKEFAFILVIIMIGAVLESIGIGAILPLISVLGDPDFLLQHSEFLFVAGKIGIHSHRDFMLAGTVSLIILYFVKNMYIAWEIYIQRRTAMKYQIFYSKEIMATYLAKSYSFHLNHNTAQLLRNVNSGAQVIFNNMFMPICYLVSELATIVAIWFMLVLVDAFTAIIVVGLMIIVILLIIRSFRKKVVRQGSIQNEASVDYLKWINQGLGAIKETKILRRESFFLMRFNEGYRKYAKALQEYGLLADLPRVIIEMLVVVGLLLLIIVKILMGNQSTDIIPLLGLLAMAAFRLMPSANRIVSCYNTVKNQMPFFNEIYDILLNIKERSIHPVAIIPDYKEEKLDFNKGLRIQHLSFHYPDGVDKILDDVSFSIPKGTFVGIVGPSGAGKTTFVDILLGLLPPTCGSIMCDDKNIMTDIRSWQGNLAYVPQDIYLLDCSIRENIALGVPVDDIDDNLLKRVLEMAELSDFVYSLTDGVDTFVGERGVKLSGGQRQRIGIARALYQKPEILILDEATSALDNETEKAITETILKFKGNITIIAIAHRVSTLAECDFKLLFENGKVSII